MNLLTLIPNYQTDFDLEDEYALNEDSKFTLNREISEIGKYKV